MQKIKLVLITACLILAGCSPVALAAEQPELAAAPTEVVVVAPTSVPTLWINPAVPVELAQAAQEAGIPLAGTPEAASVSLSISTADGTATSVWVYGLVAAFPTVRDGYSLDELKSIWAGEAGSGLVMTESTAEAMKSIFGGEAATGVIRLTAADRITDALWENRNLIGILPFEEINPKLKVLTVEGQSVLQKDFDLIQYPLKVGFYLQGSSVELPKTNRDPQKLTTVVMTGVTALVRATAYKMELIDVTYPARDIRHWLLDADIAHISNEIPFAEGCPFPNPNQRRLIFCSDPKYIALLEYVGADVIELTGNHFEDWGPDATRLTVQMYNDRNLPYFGGGIDLADSQKPALIEKNGMKFAFIGCNPSGPDFAWAREDGWPGAAPCGDLQWMIAEISRLKSEGYLVIATFQHFEYYTPEPRPQQLEDFRAVAAAGATIVSGSQAHYSQTMEFYGDSFVHYGLGNLFFDQMGYDNPSSGIRTTNTRREFLDRHVFYDGRYIGTELLTAMLEDYARPRPMTTEEREAFLLEYFIASGWIAK